MKTFNYSIIIPHHNIPHLLQRCIDSIPHRDDLQIIIVDDNSDENKVDFSNFPGLNCPNIEVYFTKDGKGAGYARNVGIQNAQGKWLVFADADDVFVTENLSVAMDKYIESDYDLIIFNPNVINADTNQEENWRLRVREHILGNTSSDQEWCRYCVNHPWAKFVKKNLIDAHSIRFEEVIAGNDAMFSTQAGFYSKSLYLDNTIIYNWLLRSRGNITSKINKNTMMSKFGVAVRINQFIDNNGINPKYRTNLFKRYMINFPKAGLSYMESWRYVYHATPKKYILGDIFKAHRFFIKKAIEKLMR